jgi:hypothetical protein
MFVSVGNTFMGCKMNQKKVFCILGAAILDFGRHIGFEAKIQGAQKLICLSMVLVTGLH